MLSEERNITQEVFYHGTGIHIGRIERAQRDISVTTLGRICGCLEVGLGEFFEGME